MHHAHPARERGGGVAGRQGLAENIDRPLIGRVVTEQDRYERRLARPVFAQQGDDFARMQAERNVVVSHQCAETLGDPAQLQDWISSVRHRDSASGFGLLVVNLDGKRTIQNRLLFGVDLGLQFGRDLVFKGTQRRQ